MEVRRTVPVTLEVTERDADLVPEPIDESRDATKNIGSVAFEGRLSGRDLSLPPSSRVPLAAPRNRDTARAARPRFSPWPRTPNTAT